MLYACNSNAGGIKSNVSDLNATRNGGCIYHLHRIKYKRLWDRGCRFVSEIANVSYEEAQKCIQACGKVKTACVMATKKCTPDQAAALLEQAGGILRKVLELLQ